MKIIIPFAHARPIQRGLEWNHPMGGTCLKLTPTLTVSDWFTPADYVTLNANDTDFGAGGCLLLPTSAGYPSTSYVLTGGKEARFLC